MTNKDISFTPIEVNIILDLLNNHNPISGLRRCRRIGCTYSTYSKSINKLQDLGILVFEKQGRTNNMHLTEIGNDFSVQLNIVKNLNI